MIIKIKGKTHFLKKKHKKAQLVQSTRNENFFLVTLMFKFHWMQISNEMIKEHR